MARKLHDYTVVGYYPDNDQPYVTSIKASTPIEAAKLVMEETPGVAVVSVLKGTHDDLLPTDKVLFPE